MELVAAILPGLLSGLIGSYVGYRFSRRAERETEGRSLRREASADLSAPLRDLRTTIRSWGRVKVTQVEVASAVIAWSEAIDRQGHRLPPKWQHVGRSVRAAVGEVFGGVAMSDLSPEMASYPLASPDFLWQNFADEYVTYVIDAIVRWGDSQSTIAKLNDFDAWLYATGRRTPRA